MRVPKLYLPSPNKLGHHAPVYYSAHPPFSVGCVCGRVRTKGGVQKVIADFRRHLAQCEKLAPRVVEAQESSEGESALRW